MAWDTRVEGAITGASQRFGVDPNLLRTFARIESGGRPNARTGSYKGLFQLSNSEFGKYGGGNIYDPVANSNAAAQKLAGEAQGFKAKYGREPQPSDLYMIHQQGAGGYGAHVANPSAPAWQNMASTAEGRQKGAGWARQAIWGNVPSDVRAQYPGGVDSLTSQQFLDLWAQKVARMGGSNAPANHMAGNAINEVSNGAQNMAGPIGGMPSQGGPVPLTPPSGRYSKLADMLMAQAAGAKPKGWGDLLNSAGDLALGYTMGNKADTEQQAYQGKLAQALMGANDVNAMSGVLMQSGDPELMKAGISAKVAASKQADPLDIERRAVAGGLQPGTPEYRDFVLKGGKGQTGEEYGTAPLYVRDTASGKVKIGQMSKAGGIKYTDVDGDVLPGTDKVDAGTEYIFRDKRTNEIVGRQPKDVAGEAAANKVGAAQGEAKADLPRVESNSDAIMSMIDNVLGDPYLPSMTGMIQGRMPNISGDSQRVQEKVNQLNGQAFLQAFSALKGGGAITEAEGAKATASLSRLQNMKVNDPDYIQAAKDFKVEVTRLRDLARRRAGVLSQQGLDQKLQSSAQPSATPDQSASDPLGIR